MTMPKPTAGSAGRRAGSRRACAAPVRSLIVLIISLVGASLPIPAVACSCEARTIADIHDKAQVLVLVRVGAEVPLVEADGKPYRTWPYELIERYKGDLTADWLWTRVRRSSCDMRLAPGAYYLVSTNGDGYVDFCDVRRLPEDPAADGEIKVLNAFRAGTIPALTQPWTFVKSDRSCRISHRFPSGHGELRFYFGADGPEHNGTERLDQDRAMQASRGPVSLRLFVRYPFGEYFADGTGRIVIGKREWHTRRIPTETTRASGYEVVGGEDALEILSELEDASSVAITWEMRELPRHLAEQWPEYPVGNAETSRPFVGDSVERFRACLVHVGMDQPAR